MDLVQQQNIRRTIAVRWARPLGVLAALVAVAVITVVAAVIVARLLTSTGPAAGAVGSPEWRAFRADERSVTAISDPLLAPAVIDFRRGERTEVVDH